MLEIRKHCPEVLGAPKSGFETQESEIIEPVENLPEPPIYDSEQTFDTKSNNVKFVYGNTWWFFKKNLM